MHNKEKSVPLVVPLDAYLHTMHRSPTVTKKNTNKCLSYFIEKNV
jgi:hypothetical protein